MNRKKVLKILFFASILIMFVVDYLNNEIFQAIWKIGYVAGFFAIYTYIRIIEDEKTKHDEYIVLFFYLIGMLASWITLAWFISDIFVSKIKYGTYIGLWKKSEDIINKDT